MGTTLVITTFSEDGYNLYGKTNIETWCKYWPENYRLRIYAEHDIHVDDHRVEIVNIHSASPSLVKFKEYSYNSISKENDKKTNNNFLRAVKWCHKVFAIEHALNEDVDYLIYLDGDTETIDYVPEGVLEQLVDNNLFAVHFEKLMGGVHYETGLMIFDMKHRQIDLLKNYITEAYNDLSIYQMKPLDGFWFAKLQKLYDLKVKDLAGGAFIGVFTNPVVKPLLRHYAGNKKYEGTDYYKYSGKTRANTKI